MKEGLTTTLILLLFGAFVWMVWILAGHFYTAISLLPQPTQDVVKYGSILWFLITGANWRPKK